MLTIPLEPNIAGWPINIHLIVEYLAFFAAYQYYVHLRKGKTDPISSSGRLSIILGAAMGAFLGSRIIGMQFVGSRHRKPAFSPVLLATDPRAIAYIRQPLSRDHHAIHGCVQFRRSLRQEIMRTYCKQGLQDHSI